jgi:hypothetical protein
MMDASQPIKLFQFPRIRVVKVLFVFTVLSIMFGILATMSPTVCSAGWVVGTMISTLGGVFYGRGAEGRLAAFGGGALVGGVSIAVGTLLAWTLGTLQVREVIAATLVGAVSGAVAALLARVISRAPASD